MKKQKKSSSLEDYYQSPFPKPAPAKKKKLLYNGYKDGTGKALLLYRPARCRTAQMSGRPLEADVYRDGISGGSFSGNSQDVSRK